MNTSDRFDRHVEDLLGDLAGQAMPSYIDEALATATARPQRRPSIVSRVFAGRTGSNGVFRLAAVGLPVVLLLTIGIVGLLVIGGPGPTPSPSPVPTLTGTDAPTTVPSTAAPPSPAPTDAAVERCPGYVDSADARTLDESGGDAWQGETGPPPPIGSLREGFIAAEAKQLDGGRSAVVLIDPVTRVTCRLIDLAANEEVQEFEWTSRGDALAIATQSRVLVWSQAGLTELQRVPDDRTSGFTVAWAPTGEAIAIGSRADQELRIVEPTWSRTELRIDSVLELAWSPDGSRLHVGYGAHTGGSVLHALVSDGEQSGRIDIGSTVGKGESVAGWLDNDTLIVGGSGEHGYDQGAPGYDAYDVTSGTRRPWASTQPLNPTIGIGYAPGLSAVALFGSIEMQSPMVVVVRDLPSGVDHVLPRIHTRDHIGTGAWSPNGSRLAVSIQAVPGAAKTGLWLYALEGGEPTQVSTLDLWLTNGAWQPLP